MITFHFQLQYQEAYDTFYLLSSKHGRKYNAVIGICLTLIASILLIFYALDSRKVHYFYLAVISILLLFYLIYSPVIKAKKGASAVVKNNGYYEIGFTEKGILHLPSSESILLSEDKHSRVVETDTIFAIRADKEHTVCLPKRILQDVQESQLRELFKNNAHYYQYIKKHP